MPYSNPNTEHKGDGHWARGRANRFSDEYKRKSILFIIESNFFFWTYISNWLWNTFISILIEFLTNVKHYNRWYFNGVSHLNRFFILLRHTEPMPFAMFGFAFKWMFMNWIRIVSIDMLLCKMGREREKWRCVWLN